MSILNSILKTFVGDKAKQDLKKITPLEVKCFETSKRPLNPQFLLLFCYPPLLKEN